jgi:hypothetical protein
MHQHTVCTSRCLTSLYFGIVTWFSMAVPGLSTWRGIITRTADTENCVNLVADMGLIPIERTCGRCGENMHWERDVFRIDGYWWRCTRQCRAFCLLRTNTFFSKSKLSLFQMLTIMYTWSRGCKQVEAVVDSEVSKNTMVDWFNFCHDFCRDVCSKAL